MSRNKTKDKLLSLTLEQSNNIGVEVERLIKDEMSYIVNKYVNQYKAAAFETFGWDREDLLQHIRIIMWKGLATFDLEKNVKVTTYLSRILYYQMGNFSKTCQSKKNSRSKLYCPGTLFENDECFDYTSTEDWAIYSKNFKVLLKKLNQKDMKVLVSHLVFNFGINEMETKLKMKKVDIVSSLKRIKEKMEMHL